jgi:hypothetical protein
VKVTIAPGKTDAYWEWAREIVALWDANGVVRAGGPYALKGPGGEDVALWLTVHGPGDDVREEFQRLYATEPGKGLIERRPPLVADTVSTLHPAWDPAPGVAPPAAPAW